MQCLVDNSRPSEDLVSFEFRDDGRYTLTCSAGHTTTTILQQMRFQVLFEIGLHAIGDGYYRESISSFSSSLERTYEFMVRALLSAKAVPQAAVDESWKLIASQSERQFGAFALLWASAFREAPSVLPKTQTELRNAVIHKGKLPTRNEAVEFGQAVLDVLQPKLKRLGTEFADSVDGMVREHLVRGAHGEGRISTVAMPLALDPLGGDVLDMGKHLARVSRRRGVRAG